MSEMRVTIEFTVDRYDDDPGWTEEDITTAELLEFFEPSASDQSENHICVLRTQLVGAAVSKGPINV